MDVGQYSFDIRNIDMNIYREFIALLKCNLWKVIASYNYVESFETLAYPTFYFVFVFFFKNI